jgi:addiction module HigA family antidote
MDRYLPTNPIPPGITLKETMSSIGLSQTELAERMGRPLKTINGILKGKVSITAETATQLERVLGVPSEFWLNLEANYQMSLAKARALEITAAEVPMVKNFPYSEVSKWGWLKRTRDKIEQLEELLSFFGVVSLNKVSSNWGVSYRKCRRYTPSPFSMACWLRKGELEARSVDTKPFDKKSFYDQLARIRTLTADNKEDFCEDIIESCANSGVAVVFVPHLKKTYVNGAARWLTPRKAIIQLSIRNRYKDIFWFTFFHEAAHILKHSKKARFVDIDDQIATKEDKEADKFARDYLIPFADWKAFTSKGEFSEASIREFSKRQNVGSDIIVGRLQHEGHLQFSQLNHLRQRLTWSQDC